jgi:hypothetical protein
MDIITDNIVLIIFLIVGAIVQWLKARGESQQQGQDPGYDPADIEEMIEDAERRRSRPAVPPPLPPAGFPHPAGTVVAPAPAPSPRRKSREPEAAPAFDTSSELARQQDIADKLKEMKRTRGAREISDSLLPRKRSAGDPVPATGFTLKSRLGNRRELRQAFVLKEILEKPVGLR